MGGLILVMGLQIELCDKRRNGSKFVYENEHREVRITTNLRAGHRPSDYE